MDKLINFTLLKLHLCGIFKRRDGRVVECGGLENHCTERYRGFESLSLRHFEKWRCRRD